MTNHVYGAQTLSSGSSEFIRTAQVDGLGRSRNAVRAALFIEIAVVSASLVLPAPLAVTTVIVVTVAAIAAVWKLSHSVPVELAAPVGMAEPLHASPTGVAADYAAPTVAVDDTGGEVGLTSDDRLPSMDSHAATDAEVTDCAMRAAAGDSAALTAFIRSTQRDVWRFIAHLGHPEDAEDLTQETYVRAIGSIHRFNGTSSARTWLLSIARRVCVDDVRRAQARPRISAVADWVHAADSAQMRPSHSWQDLVEVNLMLDRLPSERREALILTQVLGLPYQEVADIVGCPVGTIRSRVARAREAFISARTDADRRQSHGG